MRKLRLKELSHLVGPSTQSLTALAGGRAFVPGSVFFHLFRPSWDLTWFLTGKLQVVFPPWASVSSFVR